MRTWLSIFFSKLSWWLSPTAGNYNFNIQGVDGGIMFRLTNGVHILGVVVDYKEAEDIANGILGACYANGTND